MRARAAYGPKDSVRDALSADVTEPFIEALDGLLRELARCRPLQQSAGVYKGDATVTVRRGADGLGRVYVGESRTFMSVMQGDYASAPGALQGLFVGEVAALERLIAVLDPDEPIGILSHHLAMDEPGWRFLDRLLGVLAAHPGAVLCSAADLFPTQPGLSP